MNERKLMLGILGGGALAAAGIGALIYTKQQDIDAGRAEVQSLIGATEKARKTIEGTPSLEREVIVLREISEVIAQILPNGEDVTQILRDLHSYAGEAGVSMNTWGSKTSRVRGKTKSAFDTVGYQMSIEGDIFQFLDLLNRVETHSRLITVPLFTLSSASRSSIEDEGVARHKIQLNLETYTYERAESVKPVSIEGYERKRELLAGEIARRRQALTLASYAYRGPRGRRDPWVDPRVPSIDPENSLSVPEQMELVDALRDEVLAAQDELAGLQQAENMLAALVVRRELEKLVTRIEDRLRQIESDNLITYAPAKKRLENDVYGALDKLSASLSRANPAGPSKEVLVEIHELMRQHIDAGAYGLALDAYETIGNQKDLVQVDPVRKAILEHIEQAAWEARTLRDFNKVELQFGGVGIIEELPPVVLINGRSLGVGDRVSDQLEDLEILDIRPHEVDFIFRGVVLTRIF